MRLTNHRAENWPPGEFAHGAELHRADRTDGGWRDRKDRANFRGARRRHRVVAKQQFDDPPGALGAQFGLDGQERLRATRQLARQGESLARGHRIGAVQGVRPIRIAWTWALAGRAATQRRMGDRRREQRNRRVQPSVAPARGRRATARKSRRRRAARPLNSFIAAALAPAAAASGFSAPASCPAGLRRPPSSSRPSERSRRSAAARSLALEPRRTARQTAPQPMDAPGRAGGAPPTWRDARRRAARRILAMARQGGAGGRGAQGEALAQRAGERRIEANNLVEQGEAGAGEESRVTSLRRRRRLVRRPRPLTEMLVLTVVGRRGLGAASRRDRRRARRRAPRRADRRPDLSSKASGARIGPWL